MKITLLCSDARHPIHPRLLEWCDSHRGSHAIDIVGKRDEALGGDILFLISCHEIIGNDVRSRYRHVLILHASDLPERRGWSPHVWTILAGEPEFTVTLLEAQDPVDSGDVWSKVKVRLSGTEVCAEINNLLFDAELELMDWALAHHSDVRPMPQYELRATFVPRRRPEDSRIEPERTLADQFDLLRIADPDRYPAFMDFRGRRYRLVLEPFERGQE